MPFHRLPKKGTDEYDHLALEFQAPSSVNIIGSYAVKACLSPACADMIVEMPSGLFREKDHLNYRYFYKRSFYLACLRHALSAQLGDCVFEYEQQNLFKPTLLLKLKDGLSVKIRPYTTAFKSFRLAPGRSSVRQSVFSGQAPGSGLVQDVPTPMVNSSILSDMLFNEHQKALAQAVKQVPSLPEAVKLGKAWLRQRGYADLHGGLTGFHWSMLSVLMVLSGVIDPSMDELQIWKASLRFLGGLDPAKPLSLCSMPVEVPEECAGDLSVESFQAHFELVFLNPTGRLNLFWDVKRSALEVVQADARRHYQLLLQNPDEARVLLGRADEMAVKYDTTLMLPRSASSAHPDDLSGQSVFLDGLGATLRTALSDRVDSIAVHVGADRVTVGLQLNPEKAFRLVDLGPPISDKAGCEAFRQFWGAKAELRRFKDSSIKEAAVWEEHAKDRHMVVGHICRFALEKHMAVREVEVVCGQLDFAVPALSFSAVVSAFEALSKKIRGTKSLPLTVVACEPVSPACRYTALDVPVGVSAIASKPGFLPPRVPVHDVVVRLEGSGKWPQDPHAARLLKQAFMLQLARGLAQDDRLESAFATEYLDVQCEDFVFRCHLTFAGEIPMLGLNGMDASGAYELYTVRPRHARAIHTVYTRNVVYGPAVRLAKRFVEAQMLATDVTEELVELLMAHVFLHPGRYDAPHSAWTAFLRFLQLVVEHDWEAAALCVSFDGSPVEPAVTAPMTVCASYDEGKPSLWSPAKADAAADLRRLSSAAYKYLKASPLADLAPLFRRSIKPFTGVLILDPGLLTASRPVSRVTQLAMKNASLQSEVLRLMPGFDPVQMLVEDLQRNFGKHASFCLDRPAGLIAFKTQDDALPVRIKAFCRDMIIA